MAQKKKATAYVVTETVSYGSLVANRGDIYDSDHPFVKGYKDFVKPVDDVVQKEDHPAEGEEPKSGD